MGHNFDNFLNKYNRKIRSMKRIRKLVGRWKHTMSGRNKNEKIITLWNLWIIRISYEGYKDKEVEKERKNEIEGSCEARRRCGRVVNNGCSLRRSSGPCNHRYWLKENSQMVYIYMQGRKKGRNKKIENQLMASCWLNDRKWNENFERKKKKKSLI